MGEPVGAGEPQEDPGGDRPGKGRAGRWIRSRSAGWVAAGAAVVVIGGGAAAAAIHHEDEGHGHGSHSAVGGDGRHGHDGRDGHGARDGREGEQDPTAPQAPAPLPTLDAADAVVKASAAVPGGKVESLTAVTEQGGGRAWRAVVVGPDGVRHAVTVDGATDTVTGNTVLGG